MLETVEHPGSERKFQLAGSPIKMTATPSGIRRRAPIAGEHAAEILAEAGYTPGDVAALRAAKVVFSEE